MHIRSRVRGNLSSYWNELRTGFWWQLWSWDTAAGAGLHQLPLRLRLGVLQLNHGCLGTL